MPLQPSRKRPHGQDGTPPGESTNSKNNVKVVVRIRPANSKETEGNFREVVQAVDENVLVFDPKENEYIGGRKRPRDIRKRRNKDLNFAFDFVFGPTATNTDIYNETTNTVLTGLLDGYNCSVFAYGATGAGKTFTMLGSKDQPGVMYHTMMDLYSRIEAMKDTKTCDVAISYLEIYNETIRDLLMPGTALPIREDPGQGVVVQGLSLHKPKSAEELLYMLQYGNQNRTQHPTDANAESSRSHAVLQVFVRQTDRTANISAEVRIAKLCLVDLAGSERATATKNMGSRFREGANINKSLLALGNVINALAENKTKGYIPYRDSKLTRLLKDSLGGNCQTVMIAAVSPSSMTYEDTYNTLRYADRAKHIKATLKKNVLNVDFHMAKYGKIVEELRKEIFELKGKLKKYEDNKVAPSRNVAPADNVSYIEHQNKIKDFYVKHLDIKSNQLQNEITLRNLQWKMYRKQRCLSRLSTVNEPGNIETVKAIETLVSGMNQKSSCLSLSSDSSRSLLTDSYKSLGDLEQNIYNSCVLPDNTIPEVVCLSLKLHDLEEQISDNKQQMNYYKQVVRCQEKELVHNERLIHCMLKLLKKQHYIIKGHNIMTSDLSEDYNDIQRKVSGQELLWEDQSDNDVYVKGYTLSTMLDLPALKLVKEDFVQGHKEEKRNQTTKDVYNKNAVYQFTATLQNKKPALSYPIKVDECSPPKAKRACLEYKGPTNNVRSSQQITQKRMNQSVITPKKSYLTPSKSQSFCVSRSIYNSSRNLRDSRVSQTRSSSNLAKMNNQREATSVNSSSEVSSPDSKEFSNSKFLKLNDTISKKKKFSHVNTKSPSSSQETCNNEDSNHGDHDLDGTFTIDPSVNNIPVSAIPCVDCSNTVQCKKCTVLKNDNTLSVMSCVSKKSPDDNVNDKLLGAMNCGNVETYCDKYENIVQAQMYTSCLDENQTGSHDGPENESGASTIVDQSSNSVTSLASVSTLVDGQNLSQNLSIEDCSNISVVQNSDKTRGTALQNSCSMASTTSNHVQHSDTVSTSGNNTCSVQSKKNKAIRSIKFESTQNDVKSTSIEKKDKKSSTSTCKLVKERKPLSQVGSCNTSLTSPRRDSCSSITLSDCDSSFSKQCSNDKYVLSNNDIQCKENSRILNQHGLPSLVSSSILCSSNKSSGVMKRSSSRGYLQTTKAHMNRSKVTTSKPHVRSKSVSNVSSRAAWQI